jgi:hypothetical protein
VVAEGSDGQATGVGAMTAGEEARATSRPPRGGRWPDVLDQAQQQLAQAVLAAVAAGHLDRAAYQQWLAIEYALCQVGQRALLAIADWHRAQPVLRAAALEWAAEIGGHADLAATDIRALDGVAAALAPQVEAWRRFVDTASSSTRAGETLGAVVLHACLMRGAARPAIDGVRTLPFAAGVAGSHLLCRSLPGTRPGCEARESLLQAYSATALAVGAHRAAAWHRTALAAAFTTRGETP